MIPAGSACCIAPIKIEIEKITVHPKHITPEISAQEEPVFFPKFIVDLGIQVIEVIIRYRVEVRVIFLGPVDGAGKNIYIGPPSGNDKGRLLFLDRPFQGEAGGNEPDAPRTSKLFVVAFFEFDVNNGGQAAAVLGREAPFIDLEILDGIRIEGAEESKQVVGVIHNSFIQHDEVLVVASPANKNARGAL